MQPMMDAGALLGAPGWQRGCPQHNVQFPIPYDRAGMNWLVLPSGRTGREGGGGGVASTRGCHLVICTRPCWGHCRTEQLLHRHPRLQTIVPLRDLAMLDRHDRGCSSALAVQPRGNLLTSTFGAAITGRQGEQPPHRRQGTGCVCA